MWWQVKYRYKRKQVIKRILFLRLVLILVPVISFTMNYWSSSCRTCSSTPAEGSTDVTHIKCCLKCYAYIAAYLVKHCKLHNYYNFDISQSHTVGGLHVGCICVTRYKKSQLPHTIINIYKHWFYLFKVPYMAEYLKGKLLCFEWEVAICSKTVVDFL